MAGGQERILRRRIKSVQATKKITRAMELIAASRIVQGPAARRTPRVPYSEQITEVIRDLAAAGGEAEQPAAAAPAARSARSAYVVIAADRGLCGGYNTAVIRAAEREIKRATARRAIDYALVLVGRKAESYFRFRGYRIDATFTGFTDNPTYEDARAVAAAVVEPLRGGRGRPVELVYTRFISAGIQEVVQPAASCRSTPSCVDGRPATAEAGERPATSSSPSPGEILDALLPRYVEARLYAALLERGGLGARRPPAGHEGGHRQRRGAHHNAHAGDEPGPPGLHHHRDHGDRRRRRGAARRQVAGPLVDREPRHRRPATPRRPPRSPHP